MAGIPRHPRGLDIEGSSSGLVLDDDGDTYVVASTDDTIDVYVSGAKDFVITANTLTAQSGSTIATDTIAETTSATGVTIDGLLVKDGLVLEVGQVVVATITAAGGAGGATAGTFSIASKLADESTAVDRAVQMLVVVSSAQYAGLAAVNTNVTFNTASTGTLVASGSGWALVETDAAGAFACATANSSDETVYFAATTPQGMSDPTDHSVIVSTSTSATWSA